MNQLKLVVIILFAFIVAVFAVSNPQTASLNFFGKTVLPEIPMVVVVLGSILAGVLITAILGFLAQTKLKKQISALTRDNKQLKEKEEKLQLKIREFEEKYEEPGRDKEDQDRETEE
ncbi:MAG: DUF1049 domain-containing protein [Elusimicrobia bacterium]|nr:DUF1049 domain-containing protein [Elusimicrobiota bacterium]